MLLSGLILEMFAKLWNSCVVAHRSVGQMLQSSAGSEE